MQFQFQLTCQMFSDIFYEGELVRQSHQQIVLVRCCVVLMSDPESVAKWLQIRDNSLKLISLGENPGGEKNIL